MFPKQSFPTQLSEWMLSITTANYEDQQGQKQRIGFNIVFEKDGYPWGMRYFSTSEEKPVCPFCGVIGGTCSHGPLNNYCVMIEMDVIVLTRRIFGYEFIPLTADQVWVLNSAAKNIVVGWMNHNKITLPT